MSGGANDDAVLLDLVGEVLGLIDLEDLQRGMLEALMRAMPARWASLNDIGPAGVQALVIPHLDHSWVARFAELAHQNPLYQHWLRTRDGRAYRFCDVTTREELEATRLFREIYLPLGIQYQISFTLPNEPDRILAIVLHREDREFSDRERDLLNRARPFLIQAYRNAIAYSETGRPSEAGMMATLLTAGLTTREAEVVRHVALGGSNHDVAVRLGLSDRTVQKHLQNAFRKLDVTTRSAAAAVAWRVPEG